jgi:hypothetical protein
MRVLLRAASAAAVMAVLAAVVGCSATPAPAPTPVVVASAEPQDPLALVRDPTSDWYQDDFGEPLIHESGQGPTTLTVPWPEGTRGILFMVTCAPESYFTVTMGTFYAGYCGDSVGSSGEFPLDDKFEVGEPLEIILDISPGASYWLVGIPVAD